MELSTTNQSRHLHMQMASSGGTTDVLKEAIINLTKEAKKIGLTICENVICWNNTEAN